MKIINAGYEILTPLDRAEILQTIERAGRTCYKSEENITETSASRFVKRLVKHGHEAMIEHVSVTVRVTCDRGVSHEWVRHRIAAYAQESTRYCNYAHDKHGNEITVIAPCFWPADSAPYATWKTACLAAERAYFDLLANGATPEQARSVLPNSLKTELIATLNLRAWRNFFKLRTTDNVHPQMLEVARPLLAELQRALPEVFGDM